ncbi:cell division protein FtsQ/DivIB [Sediminispirochaeta bajacaliforniensis]|uniref:cell division protein FtsQ/DivIB n=1 Tax=Sediminispirochaeta bajacaliforniensis TaxID=148 RepID=UPI00037F93D0|nr:FtsQ-type POTRA domain-containing protein [Sediminispirochaeta bajacaliforniensis]
MSSIAYWQDSVRRKNSESANGLEKIFFVVILFLFLVLFGELCFHFVISPRLVVNDITIHVGRSFPLSDSEILSIAGIDSGGSYLAIDPQIVARKLESVPFIAKAAVEKKFPGSLSISITERVPVASTIAELDGRSVPLFVSADGVLFPYPGKESSGMPVLSGIEIPKLSGRMFVPSALVSFLSDLEKVRNTSPELYRLISELKFIKKNGDDYEVLLFPAHRKVRVRIGTSIDEQLLTYIMMVLDVVSQQNMVDKLDEIDFRTGEVVYKIREE